MARSGGHNKRTGFASDNAALVGSMRLGALFVTLPTPERRIFAAGLPYRTLNRPARRASRPQPEAACEGAARAIRRSVALSQPAWESAPRMRTRVNRPSRI